MKEEEAPRASFVHALFEPQLFSLSAIFFAAAQDSKKGLPMADGHPALGWALIVLSILFWLGESQ